MNPTDELKNGFKRHSVKSCILLAFWLISTAFGTADTAPTPGRTFTQFFPMVSKAKDPPPAEILIGAGDIISGCSPDGSYMSGPDETAEILDREPGTIFTTGDNDNGGAYDYAFNKCFQDTWGRNKARIRPALGNHEYHYPRAGTYFNYFGEAAGPRYQGYYSYDLGKWHIIVLNSNCKEIGGCENGSQQETWLRQDLADHPSFCSLAYWHHPRFSSGSYAEPDLTRDFWQDLYNAGVDVVLNGHDHMYERFAPLNTDGNEDPMYGIRQFTVGTGGAFLFGMPGEPAPHSERQIVGVHGVLKLKLHENSYEWQFLPAGGRTETDSGAGGCH